MGVWQEKAVEALHVILGNPGSGTELAALCLVAAIVFIIVLERLSSLMSFPVKGTPLAMVVFIGGSLGILLSAAGAIIYVEPLSFVKSMKLEPFIPFIGGLLSVPVLMTPLLWITHRTKYTQGLIAALLSICGAAIAVMLTIAAIGAFKSGDKDFNRTRSRTQEVNRFLDT